MASTKQVSDLIVKLIRLNTNNMLVSDLNELQRNFRGVESDLKLAENKAQQAAVDIAKLKKDVDTLKKRLAEAAAQPAPAAAAPGAKPGEPQRVAVGFEWKSQK
jgi:chromosome segregation ATPase